MVPRGDLSSQVAQECAACPAVPSCFLLPPGNIRLEAAQFTRPFVSFSSYEIRGGFPHGVPPGIAFRATGFLDLTLHPPATLRQSSVLCRRDTGQACGRVSRGCRTESTDTVAPAPRTYSVAVLGVGGRLWASRGLTSDCGQADSFRRLQGHHLPPRGACGSRFPGLWFCMPQALLPSDPCTGVLHLCPVQKPVMTPGLSAGDGPHLRVLHMITSAKPPVPHVATSPRVTGIRAWTCGGQCLPTTAPGGREGLSPVVQSQAGPQ